MVDLLGIPSCRRSARIVSSKSFIAMNVAAGEDSATKEAIGTAALGHMDTEQVLQVPSSMAKSVCQLQSLLLISRCQ